MPDPVSTLTVAAYYAVCIVCSKRHKMVECPSVCPVDRQQQRCRRFAAEVGRGQQISIDVCCRATCGPRKFWSDFKEAQHTCSTCLITTALDAVQRRVRCEDCRNVIVMNFFSKFLNYFAQLQEIYLKLARYFVLKHCYRPC